MKGTYTALVTPFSEAGIDIKRLVRLIDFQYKNGADGVVLLGTTGEAPTISEREADEIIYEGLKAAEGKIDVVIGCSSNSTAEAVKKNGIYKRAQALPPRRKPFRRARKARKFFPWKTLSRCAPRGRTHPRNRAARKIFRPPFRLRTQYIRPVARLWIPVFFPRYYCMRNAANYLTSFYSSVLMYYNCLYY